VSQDTLAYDEVLKTVYEGGIRELIPLKVPMYNRFEERPASEWGGRYVEYPIKVGRNQGSGWGSENGALPTAGRQKYATVRIPMRYMYGRASFSAQVMKASQGSRNAFAPAMEQEMDGLIKDMTSDLGRTVWGDGKGVLALVNGTTATTTVTVDSPGGVAGATNGARFINADQILAAIVPATGSLVSSSAMSVTAVPAAGTTFTRNDTTSLTDNYYLVRAMNSSVTDVSDTSYAKEAMGLLGLVDDGTYVATLHNVNRTSYPLFQSTVIPDVGSLSADVLQRGVDLADQRGDGDIDLLAMHHSVRRAYIAVTDDARRYMGGDLSSPDAGTKAAKKQRLTFGGIPMETDKHAPYGTIFGLDTSSMRRYVEVAGEWIDEDGSILQRIGSGSTMQDAFEAVYRMWFNLHIEKPNTCFRLDDVTATVTVAHID
jgi:hypothetical protein